MTGQDPVDDIIGRYRDALDRGEAVDPEQVIRMHPELADVLRHRFAALRLLDRAFTSARTEPVPGPGPRVRHGQRLGPYLLRSELGSGGMGTVFLARTMRDTEALKEGTEVALKVVHPHLPAKHGFLERFHQEVAAGRRVRHANVVPTYDMGEVRLGEATTLYMSMAYVEGQTLRDLLQDLGRVPEALVREILRQVADGLSAIHAAGIVHRDLKPENILVTEDHEVRITDLGVARLMEASQRLTSVGQFAGSVMYAAPEQFRGDHVGAPTDLYALGVVAYELLTGENPFRHDASMAVMRAHLEHRPPPLTDTKAEVSPFLSSVVAQLLAKDSERRFPSAAHLRDVLAAGESSEWWAERETAARGRDRRVPRIPVRRETRLYGRERALARLKRAWEDARAGHGNTLLIVGEPGIGKSRLVDAFLETIDGEDAHVLYGSYAPAYAAGALTSAILDHFGSSDLASALRPYLAETPGLVPAAVSSVLGLGRTEDAPPLPIDALQAVAANLVRALADERPLLWVVDDLDGAYGDALKVVLAMARALEGHRVLLVLTTGQDLDPETAAALGRMPNTSRFELSRLSPREVVELLQDAFHSQALAERLGVKIAYKSDGVPFFVFEMIRSLRDGRFIEELPDGTFTQSRIVDEIEVPSVVRDLVRARLADVSKEERAILDIGAVEGFEFDADLVARVLERKRVAVLQDLADVERRLGLVRAAGRMFQFDHHQIREVVYEDLTPALRADYHGLLAEAYLAREGTGEISGQAAAFLALHLLRGTSPAGTKPYVLPALAHLRATFRHEAALEIAENALAQSGLLESADRIEVLSGAATGFELLGRWDDEKTALEEAMALADAGGDMAQRAALRTRLGHLHARRAAWDEARGAYDAALEIARTSGDGAAAARAEAGRADMLRVLGEYDAAETHYERAREMARTSSDLRGEWTALIGLADLAKRRGQNEKASTLYAQAMGLAETVGDDRAVSRTCSSFGSALMKLGRYDEARAQNERAVEISRRIGDRVGEVYAVGNLGNLHTRVARFEEARVCQERALDIAREIGDRRAEAAGFANLGMVHLHLDELERARASFEAKLAVSAELLDRDGEAWATLRLGDVDLKSDAPNRARERFDRALDLARRLGDRWMEGLALGNLGAALLGLGRLDEARSRLLESHAIAREVGDRQGEGAAEGDLAALHVAIGSTDRAREYAKRCQHISSTIGDRRGEAYAEHLHALVRLHEGDEEGAAEHFESAREIAHAIGGRRRDAWAALGLAEVAQAVGQPLKARRLAREAHAAGRDVGSPSLRTLARCRLALLPGGDVAAALRLLGTLGADLPLAHRIEAHHLLGQATGDREHLQEAWRLIQVLRRYAPEDCQTTIDTVPSYRAVREALDASAE